MQTREKEISLRKLLITLKQSIVWIIIATVVVGVAGGVFTKLLSKETYSCESKYLIITSSTSSAGSYQDTLKEKNRAADIVEIIEARTTVRSVLNNAQIDYGGNEETVNKILGMISPSVLGTTSTISIKVTAATADTALQVAQAFEHYLPDYIEYDIFSEDKTTLKPYEYAELPKSANSVHTTRNAVLCAAIAFVISFAVAFVRFSVDTTVYGDDTLQNEFPELPILGQIPSWNTKKLPRSLRRLEKKDIYRNYDDKLINENTPFGVSESFRGLRTNVSYTASGEGKNKIVGVTGTRSGEGKSVLASNLALTYAKLNKKVVLIDGDMRKSSLQAIFKYKSKNGLSEFLAGIVDNYEDVLVRNYTENLDIIPVGNLPPNPAELLASERMGELLEKLSQTYDLVLIDLPPMGSVSDAGVIAKRVGSYLLAVRANYSSTVAVARVMREMERLNMKISGFVLTDTVTKKYYGTYAKRYYNYDGVHTGVVVNETNTATDSTVKADADSAKDGENAEKN